MACMHVPLSMFDLGSLLTHHHGCGVVSSVRARGVGAGVASSGGGTDEPLR